MKVWVRFDLDAFDRFVIARYWSSVSSGLDTTRRRATRAQSRRFVLAAIRTAVNQHADDLRGRHGKTARRLANARETTGAQGETLRPPIEEQRSLRW